MRSRIFNLTIPVAICLLMACNGQPKTESSAEQQAEATTTTTTPQPTEAAPANSLLLTQYAGEYAYGDDPEKTATGNLKVYPLSDNEALFYLDLTNGPPGYHSGSVSGKMMVKGSVAVYEINEDEYSNCKLIFHFSSGEVKIETEEGRGECGFGYGVVADGTYSQKSKDLPEYFIGGEGDTTFFKNMLSGQ